MSNEAWLPRVEYDETITNIVRQQRKRDWRRKDLIEAAIASLESRLCDADYEILVGGAKRCVKMADWAIQDLATNGIITRTRRGSWRAA